MLSLGMLQLMLDFPCEVIANANTAASLDTFRFLPAEYFSEQVVYLGETAEVCRILDDPRTPSSAALTILCAGVRRGLEIYKNRSGLNLLYFDVSLARLSNRVLNKFQRFQKLMTIAEKGIGNQDIAFVIDALAKLTHCRVSLEDSNSRLICADSRDGWDSVEFVRDLCQDINWHERYNCSEFLTSMGHYGYKFVLDSKGSSLANLLVYSPYSKQNTELQKFFFDFIPYLLSYCNRLYSNQRRASSDFSAFLFDVLEQNIVTQEELEKRMLNLEIPSPYRVIIAAAVDGRVALRKETILRELGSIFHCSSCGVYRKRYVVLAPVTKKGNELYADREALNTFLSANNMYACLGHGSDKLSDLYGIYYQTKVCMDAAGDLNNTLRGECFDVDDYLVSYIAHLSVSNANFCSCDPRCLLPKDYLGLLHYDQYNNTDYTKLLTRYLLSNGNISQTAKDLFMHRNTLSRKISMIQEIIDINLDDSNARMRLLLSSYIYSYLDKDNESSVG